MGWQAAHHALVGAGSASAAADESGTIGFAGWSVALASDHVARDNLKSSCSGSGGLEEFSAVGFHADIFFGIKWL